MGPWNFGVPASAGVSGGAPSAAMYTEEVNRTPRDWYWLVTVVPSEYSLKVIASVAGRATGAADLAFAEEDDPSPRARGAAARSTVSESSAARTAGTNSRATMGAHTLGR